MPGFLNPILLIHPLCLNEYRNVLKICPMRPSLGSNVKLPLIEQAFRKFK